MGRSNLTTPVSTRIAQGPGLNYRGAYPPGLPRWTPEIDSLETWRPRSLINSKNVISVPALRMFIRSNKNANQIEIIDAHYVITLPTITIYAKVIPKISSLSNFFFSFLTLPTQRVRHSFQTPQRPKSTSFDSHSFPLLKKSQSIHIHTLLNPASPGDENQSQKCNFQLPQPSPPCCWPPALSLADSRLT